MDNHGSRGGNRRPRDPRDPNGSRESRRPRGPREPTEPREPYEPRGSRYGQPGRRGPYSGHAPYGTPPASWDQEWDQELINNPVPRAPSHTKSGPPNQVEDWAEEEPEQLGLTSEVIAFPPPPHDVAASTLGRLPMLAVVGALGLLMISSAYAGSRLGVWWSQPLFWGGLVVVFVPIAVRLFTMRTANSVERVGLLMVLGVLLYLVHILASPLGFSQFDEFSHLRILEDILSTHHLFQPSAVLPVGPHYPGLEIVTSMICGLTGLPPYLAGFILIGVAKVLLVIVLYLLFEHISGSPRLAGIAAAIYMTNSHFFMFDGLFSYESLGLVLVVWVLYLVARMVDQRVRHRQAYTMIVVLGLAATVVTHHVSSFVLVGILLLWAITSLVRSRRVWDSSTIAVVAMLGLAMVLFWTLATDLSVVAYLDPLVRNGLSAFVRVIQGQAPNRQFFHDYAGGVIPGWQQMLVYLSQALVVLALPFGIYRVWRHRANAAVLAFTLIALGYPLMQPLRLNGASGEFAVRATEFLFLGVSLVLAIGLAQMRRLSRPSRRMVGLVAVGAAVLFLGGFIYGSGSPWNYLPGPYMVEADPRSINLESTMAAQWMRTTLGPNHHLAVDHSNLMPFQSYGRQWPVTAIADGVDVSPLYTSVNWNPQDRAITARGHIEYVVVDQRLDSALPALGIYFQRGEPGAYTYTQPLSKIGLNKFDGVYLMDRVFDSGNVVIYGTRELTNG